MPIDAKRALEKDILIQPTKKAKTLTFNLTSVSNIPLFGPPKSILKNKSDILKNEETFKPLNPKDEFNQIISTLIEKTHSDTASKKEQAAKYLRSQKLGEIITAIADTHHSHIYDETLNLTEKTLLINLTIKLLAKAFSFYPQPFLKDYLETLQKDFICADFTTKQKIYQKKYANKTFDDFKKIINKYLTDIEKNHPENFVKLLAGVVSTLKLNILKISASSSINDEAISIPKNALTM